MITKQEIDYYKKKELMKRIADLMFKEQGRLDVSNEVMSRRLDISCRTYERLINRESSGFSADTLVKILSNSSITYDDIFGDIYQSKHKIGAS